MPTINMTQDELKKLVKSIVDRELESSKKNTISEKEVKKLIQDTIVGLFKFLYQKSPVYINQI